MPHDQSNNSRSRVLRPLADIGSRAATTALRPLTDAMGVAVEAGISLERRAIDRVLDSGELERLLTTTLDSPRFQAAVRSALATDGAKRLIDSIFDSGLIDRVLERLSTSESLWRLVDEIAASPAVTAAISQQGLGFADQVGGEVRSRSRKADDWLERYARRLVHRQQAAAPPEPEASTS